MIRFNVAEIGKSMMGELKVLKKVNDLEYAVQFSLLNPKRNLNGWSYQNLEKYMSTFAGTPILTAYLPDGTVGDGHNMRETTDLETGERYMSFEDATAERIVGVLSDKPGEIWIEEIDGTPWIRANGRLFSFYNKRLVDKIAKQGSMRVSVETEVTQSHTEDDTEIFTEWRGLGVTVLGDNVQEACVGANIKAAAFKAAQAKLKEMQLKAAQLENAEHNKAKKSYSVIFSKKE